MHCEICTISDISTFTGFHNQRKAPWLHELHIRKAHYSHGKVNKTILPRLPVTRRYKYSKALISFSWEYYELQKRDCDYIQLCNNKILKLLLSIYILFQATLSHGWKIPLNLPRALHRLHDFDFFQLNNCEQSCHLYM